MTDEGRSHARRAGAVTATAFDAALRERVRRNLAAHERTTLPDGGRRHAAVAVTLVPDADGEACFLLTRRASRLQSHRGQWALPGGRVDVGEGAESAVVRELREEVGVDVVEILGMLDDYATRSGYRITPFVAWAEPAALTPNPEEVEAVYRIPVAELLRPDSPRFVQHPETDGPLLQIPIRDRLVHAPTGAILYQLREVALAGRSMRVAQFDQPPFAWR